MRRASPILLVLLAVGHAQDEKVEDRGGRDTGKGAPPILFVRSARTAESAAIYRAAWKALEPFYGLMSRERLYDFDGEPNRANKFYSERGHAKLVVAFDAQAAKWTPERFPVLRVGPDAGAMVDTRADRAQVANILRLFRPTARKVAVFGASTENLRGFELVACTESTQAKGCDLAWVTEDARVDGRKLRAKLDDLGVPLVSTSAILPEGLSAVSVRPDPNGLGLQLAAQVLESVRSARAFRPTRIERHRVVVDLDAARAAGVRVRLRMLARADVVRRSP